MANWQDPQTTRLDSATVSVPHASRDVGLRSYMLSVYNYMASGVLLTGVVAMLFAPYAAQYLISPSGRGMSMLGWIVMLSPLAIVFAMSFGANRMRSASLQMLFWAFAGLMGLSMSTLFLVYTGESIAQTFFAVSAGFMGLSLFGYTTKRDLSAWGSFLIMGVIGIIVAVVLNMFLRSPALNLAISAIGVLVFAGLTAYDTQKIKSIYFALAGDSEAMAKSAVMGALRLYLDFINMFQFLLSFMGNRR